jgi:hypothetical protein
MISSLNHVSCRAKIAIIFVMVYNEEANVAFEGHEGKGSGKIII